MITKFKTGDTIKPIAGKKTSNSYRLENIIIAEVTRLPTYSYCGKTEIGIRLIKGSSRSGYNYAGPGDYFTVFTDAFELANNTEDYEIY